jgi:protease-4
MKKSPLIFLYFIFIIFSINIRSQDFNLFNPSNEIYLFSAYDEGANAFRYNPAVLGLGHKMNAAVNIFLNNISDHLDANEYDFLLNTGNFGVSFRKAYFQNLAIILSGTTPALNTFSIGFGFGNKSFSGGILLEWRNSDILKSPFYSDNDNSDFRGGLGFLFRPNNFISTALTIKGNESINSQGESSAIKYNIGVAFKPLKNDFVNLMADFGFIPYYHQGFFQHHILKIGANIQPVKGLYLNANYTRINEYSARDFFNIGFTFEMPHSSVKYTNTMYKFTDRSNSPASYKNAGTQLSFAFNFEKKPSVVVPKPKILEITLSGSLQDYNTDDVFFGMLGRGKRSVHEVIADIDYAANDKAISGLLLKIYPLNSGRFEISAAIEELGNAIERFKSKGKSVTAYFAQDAGPAEYYLASFADNIVLPDEAVFYYGLSLDIINFKGFLEKYGIELQTFYAGKYKLTFQGLLDSTTEEGKEVINRVLDVIYDKMLKQVSYSRNLTIDDYLKTKLSQPLTGREAKRLGLVDANGWYQDAKDLAEKESKTKGFITSYNRNTWDKGWSEPDEIAVIGVYGTITPGESEAPSPIQLPIPFTGGRSTGSETVVRQLEDAFANPKVKAIILRVDSGGGSALGSAEINAAVIRLKKKYNKPFYVSMGGAAASGGYYVSVSADKIFCDELTITGSIGVFFAKPNLDSLVKGQKIKVENFKRGEFSDISSIYKPVSEKEIEIIQGMIDYYYDNFITAVSEGRKITKEEADKVAQGRVWLGSDAFNKQLVDEIGGLYDAVSYAKRQNKIGNRFKLTYYAVPGGETINQIVTTSVLQYFENSLTKLFGLDDEDDGIDIKY